MEDLLTDRLRVLGADHQDTLTTRHNLASWPGRAGDATGAELNTNMTRHPQHAAARRSGPHTPRSLE